jgi:ketosteroid isomerase-like protein
MPSENADAVRRLYEDGWSKGDFSAGSDLWDPEIECVVELGSEFLDFSGSTRGVEAMAEMWRKQLQAWEDYNTGEIEELIDAGEKITVMSCHWGRGKHSGVEVTNPERAAVFTFRDGKVVRLVLTSRRRALEAQQADDV